MAATTNTFIAPDLYNLTLPITPPADLVLPPSFFAPSFFMNRLGGTERDVIGFSPTSSPYLTGLGLFCNIGDGLVNIAPYNGNASAGPQGIVLRLEGWNIGVNAIGVSNTAGSTSITGFGYLALSPTDSIFWRDDAGVYRQATIITITNDTAAILSSPTLSTGMYTHNTTLKDGQSLNGNGSTGSIDVTLPSLNQIFDYALPLVDVSSLIPPPAGKSQFIAVRCSITSTMSFSTITVDPAFSTKRLMFNAVATIEHTFPTSFAI